MPLCNQQPVIPSSIFLHPLETVLYTKGGGIPHLEGGPCDWKADRQRKYADAFKYSEALTKSDQSVGLRYKEKS